MNCNIIALLTETDDRKAFAFAGKVISESLAGAVWYPYFDEVASLLDHPKSLVRNRAMEILAANAAWDTEGRFDAVIDAFLSHVTDEKPITARQCVKTLSRIGLAKPQYIPRILPCLLEADLSKYKDSMRPLIEKDIAETAGFLETVMKKERDDDCILGWNVINHTDTEGVEQTISEIKRILRADGECYLTFGSKQTWGWQQDWPMVDANTKLRMEEGPEYKVPHFYADKELLTELFADFGSISLTHVEDWGKNNRGIHYHILVKKHE